MSTKITMIDISRQRLYFYNQLLAQNEYNLDGQTAAEVFKELMFRSLNAALQKIYSDQQKPVDYTLPGRTVFTAFDVGPLWRDCCELYSYMLIEDITHIVNKPSHNAHRIFDMLVAENTLILSMSEFL